MPMLNLDLPSLPHSVFLHRVVDAPHGPDAKLGQGAFLALRLVDLLDGAQSATHPDAFEYQWAATDRFCRGLGNTTEAAHLKDLVATAIGAYRNRDIGLLA